MKQNLNFVWIRLVVVMVAGSMFFFSCSNSKSSDIASRLIQPATMDNTIEIEEDDDSYDGDVSIGVVPNIYTLKKSNCFVAVREDGSLISWSDPKADGSDCKPNDPSDSSESSDSNNETNGNDPNKTVKIKSIVATEKAFAALREDGTVISWGNSDYGGNFSSKSDKLVSVRDIKASERAFIALKTDGSIVVWGAANFGASIPSNISSNLKSGVEEIWASARGFAARKGNGQLYSWGNVLFNSNENNKYVELTQIKSVYTNTHCFSSVSNDGTIQYWGDKCISDNPDSNNHVPKLKVVSQPDKSIGIKELSSTDYGFSALMNDGSVLYWGHKYYGGNPPALVKQGLADNFNPAKELRSTAWGLSVLKADGTVISWGSKIAAINDNSENLAELQNPSKKVESLYSGNTLFVALRSDKSAVLWGRNDIFKKIDRTVKKVLSFKDSFFFVKKSSLFHICLDKSGGGLDCFDKKIEGLKIKRVYSDSLGNAAILSRDGRIYSLEISSKEITPLFTDRATAVGIVPNSRAFAALLSDGSVVAWGQESYGGVMEISTSRELNGTIKVSERSN